MFMGNFKKEKGERNSSKGWWHRCKVTQLEVSAAKPCSKTRSARSATGVLTGEGHPDAPPSRLLISWVQRQESSEPFFSRRSCSQSPSLAPCSSAPKLPCANLALPDPPTTPHSSICHTSHSARIFHSSGAKCGPAGKWKQSGKGHPEQPFLPDTDAIPLFYFACATSWSLKAQDGFAGGEKLAALLHWEGNKHLLQLAIKWLTISSQCSGRRVSRPQSITLTAMLRNKTCPISSPARSGYLAQSSTRKNCTKRCETIRQCQTSLCCEYYRHF